MSDRDPEIGFEFEFEEVFETEDYLYFYLDFLPEERTEEQVAALVDLLRLETSCRILDLACGFGRHANRLAALGHSITGVDFSEGFLAMAREEARKRGVQVNYLQRDMREIDFESEFDRVMILFTAFGYFTDEENLTVLRKANRALKPRGLLVFDIPNRDVTLRGFTPFIVTEKEGNLMIDRNSFDMVSGRMYNRRIVIRDGVRREKRFFIRHYNATEIKALLVAAGLEVVGLYGDWKRGPLSPESRRMIVLARKPVE